jgi:hypothetical protein
METPGILNFRFLIVDFRLLTGRGLLEAMKGQEQVETIRFYT